jgi:phosphoribosylformimino-5-aminoimidazole carboxamide ribotide isomerase
LLVIPAIDLSEGRCVRLVQGDMHQKTVYSDSPADVARRWVDDGAELIHVVDLDGAVSGIRANADSLAAICAAAEVPVEVGGGIRSVADVRTVLGLGASYAIMGTTALRHPDVLAEALEAEPERIIVGIDARDGKVAVEGWTEATDVSAVGLAHEMEEMGVQRIIATDIATDGVLTGPNLSAMTAIAEAVRIEVIASGGVSALDDIRALAALEPLGIAGCIVGRALYERAFSLPDAIRAGAGPVATE